MKTTIDLDDDLLAAVKDVARRRGTTMRVVVEEALRSALSTPAPTPFTLDLPTTTGRRPPTIDVDQNAEIDAYLDAVDARG